MAAIRVELAEVALPEFGLPKTEPEVPAETYEQRVEAARQRATAAGYDALLVYGDREHLANLAYLTRYDRRFEEALLILLPDRAPTLLVGNEGWGYTTIIPVKFERVLYQSFSLLGQPRESSAPLTSILRDAGIKAGHRLGVAGWKYFTAREAPDPSRWLEVP